MTATFSRLFPPAHGATVGQLVPRLRRPRWLLRSIATLTLVLIIVLAATVAALSFADWTAADTEFLLFETLFIMLLGAISADAQLATKPTEFVVRLSGRGIEGAAGESAVAVPWSNAQRIALVDSGSICPVVYIAADEFSRFAPEGVRWRVKAYANRRLFGTPLGAPLASTGLSEPGLLDAVRGYRQQAGGTATGRPTPMVDDAAGAQLSPDSRRFRNRLVVALAAVAVVLAGAAWSAAAALIRLETVPDAVGDEAGDALRTVAACALALAATLAVAQLAMSVYHAMVPLGGAASRFREPVLRMGPEGVEHIVRGKRVRLPWSAVRRVYLTAGRSGARFVCVTTDDRLALVPRVGGWQANARRNEQRYGAPVAVPLEGSGVTEEDLMNAVRHYCGGHVTVG